MWILYKESIITESTLRELDIIKSELPYKKGMISFKSISPESHLFNLVFLKYYFQDLELDGYLGMKNS